MSRADDWGGHEKKGIIGQGQKQSEILEAFQSLPRTFKSVVHLAQGCK